MPYGLLHEARHLLLLQRKCLKEEDQRKLLPSCTGTRSTPNVITPV